MVDNSCRISVKFKIISIYLFECSLFGSQSFRSSYFIPFIGRSENIYFLAVFIFCLDAISSFSIIYAISVGFTCQTVSSHHILTSRNSTNYHIDAIKQVYPVLRCHSIGIRNGFLSKMNQIGCLIYGSGITDDGK